MPLTQDSRVLEIACNDGYLLQYFRPYGVPVKGIEPAENVAAEARKKGIEVQCCFFGADSARDIVALVIGSNVLADVPDIKILQVKVSDKYYPVFKFWARAFLCLFSEKSWCGILRP